VKEGKTMKRIGKYAALAAAVGLCLLLTGCYQPPDEINNGWTQDTATLPFQTRAELPTLTPDTVVVETQNIFETLSPRQDTAETATPAAGGNGWDSWGTLQGDDGNTPSPTPIPEGTNLWDLIGTVTTVPPTDGTIAVVTQSPPAQTPTPTVAPVTPSPTPKSLQVGFKNSDSVRAVQKRLKELGYYKGSADGDFGPATEAAVKAFQKANGPDRRRQGGQPDPGKAELEKRGDGETGECHRHPEDHREADREGNRDPAGHGHAEPEQGLLSDCRLLRREGEDPAAPAD
jgi:Putative peptidoglycan-binding domain-containing protein